MHYRGAVPPHMLESLRKHPDDRVRDAVSATMADLSPETTDVRLVERSSAERVARLQRLVYDCGGETRLPGIARRRERQPPANDGDVDRAYDATGKAYEFFRDAYGRESIDGHGSHIITSVHYGRRFDNAIWNGAELVCGDGDGIVFRSFTSCLDIVAHELVHGLIQAEGGLDYVGESGALNESIADVFGLLVKQWSLGTAVGAADWTVGAGQFTPAVSGRGLRSLSEPGSAYDDPILGKDPQPSHMRDYVEPMKQNADVHINSGIPNHAFYVLATSLGGRAWDKAGHIWYDALCSGLSRRSTFATFAKATLHAARSYGRTAVAETERAWRSVGIHQHALEGARG